MEGGLEMKMKSVSVERGWGPALCLPSRVAPSHCQHARLQVGGVGPGELPFRDVPSITASWLSLD